MGALEKSTHRRVGGIRKDRCFKIYLRMPYGLSEDQVMDFLEDVIVDAIEKLPTENRLGAIPVDTICVKRRSPKYGTECTT